MIWSSEVQVVVLVLQPGTVFTVELTEPASVLQDGGVFFGEQRFGDVLLVVPNHDITIKLFTQTEQQREQGNLSEMPSGPRG